MTALWRGRCSDASGLPLLLFGLFAFRSRLGFWFWLRDERFGQAWYVIGALGNGNCRAFEVVADRFEAAAKLLGEECFRHGIERLVVFRAVKAVALVGVENVRDRNVFIGHRFDDL